MNKALVLIFDLDDTLYQKHGVVADDYSGIENIKLYPGAKELLAQLKTKFKLVLVTKGDAVIQNKKIDLLQIRKQFNQILICSLPEEKKTCFLSIKRKFSKYKYKYVVIGDKLGEEIRYGNELKMITIRLQKGKYGQESPQKEYETPNYTVYNIPELKATLNAIK